MKRARAFASYSNPNPNPVVNDEVLDLGDIIKCIAPTFVFQNMDAKKGELITVEFDVFPDATMGKNDDTFKVDDKTVLIRPKQYELLINMHSNVLTARLDNMELDCTLNKEVYIDYDCYHRNLIVKEGYATWEISVKLLSK